MAEQPSAGAALEQVVRNDLPEGVELDPREEALLRAAAVQADDIQALERDIRDRGHAIRVFGWPAGWRPLFYG